MRKLKCCIIDDEPLAQELVKSYVEQTPFLEYVKSFPSASLAVKTIISEDIDLVFLDIQMSELNGIEFARVIPSKCRIVFITAFEQYAVQAFKANALDYLLKPVAYTDFFAAAQKALQYFTMLEKTTSNDNSDNDCIIVKSEYKLVQIPVKKILFVEGLKDYVKIYLDDETTVMSLMSLKTMESNLPSSMFLRVHRSFIVQTSKIKLIERNRIVFGKHYIPVSDSYKANFLEYVNRHTLSPIRDV